MNIKFIKAKKPSYNSIEVTYSLNSTEFTVEWNNIHEGTGEIVDYDLQLNTKSSNEDLAIRVDDAIQKGEVDSNIDLELYLFIRDTFNETDCEDFEINRKQAIIDEIIESGAKYVKTTISPESCAVAIAINDIENADFEPDTFDDDNFLWIETTIGLDKEDY